MHVRYAGIAGLGPVLPVAVVVDVMRAFTTAAYALGGGADNVILAGSNEEVIALKTERPGVVAVTDGPPAAGFDTVNSPAMVAALELTCRTVAMKTTAGTTGALAARHAGLLLCASFVVADATAALLRTTHADDITFVISGDGGHAEEDRACAEYIARRIVNGDHDVCPYLHRASRSAAAARLREGQRLGYRGIHPEDIALCLDANRFPFAMAASTENSLLALRPHSTAAPGARDQLERARDGRAGEDCQRQV